MPVLTDNFHLSYYKVETDRVFSTKTYIEVFDETVARVGNKPMIIFRHPNSPRKSISFLELRDEANKLAYGLRAVGIEIKDKVGILMNNCIDYVKFDHGVIRSGAVLTRMHRGMKSGEDLLLLLKKSEAKALIVTYEDLEVIQELFPEVKSGEKIKNAKLPNLKLLIYVNMNDETTTPNGSLNSRTLLSYSEKLTRTQIEEALSKQVWEKINYDDVVAIFPTSGSTGVPKLVQHTHFSVINSMEATIKINKIFENDVFFSDRPLSHIGGSAGPSYAAFTGLTNVLVRPEVTVAAENAKFIIQVLKEEKCTHGLFFPYLLFDIMSSSDEKIPITKGMLGGQVISEEMMDKTLDVIPLAFNGYGSTETLLTICTNDEDDRKRKVSHIGKPLDDFEVKVVDRKGYTVKADDLGELWIRGYSVMEGYLNEPEKTGLVFSRDKWYRTGDVARMDKDGYVTVLGRSEDLIIRATMNIYPVDVEKLLQGHPAVSVCQVVGVPDIRLGEEVCACVKLKEGFKVTEQELKEFCEAKTIKGPDGLSNAPKYVLLFKEFATATTGKTHKAAIRKQAIKLLNQKMQPY